MNFVSSGDTLKLVVLGYMSGSGIEASVFMKTTGKSSKKWPDYQLHFLSASPPDDGSPYKLVNVQAEVGFAIILTIHVCCISVLAPVAA